MSPSATRIRDELAKEWRAHGERADRRLDLAQQMAYYLEYGEFLEVAKRLSSPPSVMKQNFISGVISGLVAAVGLIVLASIAAAVLALVGV